MKKFGSDKFIYFIIIVLNKNLLIISRLVETSKGLSIYFPPLKYIKINSYIWSIRMEFIASRNPGIIIELNSSYFFADIKERIENIT